MAKGVCVVKGAMHGDGDTWQRRHVWQRGACVSKGCALLKGHT